MYLWITCSGEQTTQMQCNFSLFHRKSCCDSLMRESESMVYAKMGVWERMPLRSHSLSIPFSSFTRMGWRRRSRCPYCVQYAALWRQMTVERHYTRLPERLGAGKSKTRAACHGGGAKKAVAAMTCPGVPTHRKRLRPAERVETESADMQEPEAG